MHVIFLIEPKHGIEAANHSLPSINRSRHRKVLDCGSPLPLFEAVVVFQSARGLAQSKTLARYNPPHQLEANYN